MGHKGKNKVGLHEEQRIIVAVRVRPFNEREIRNRCVNCIQMSGNTTTVTDPKTKLQKTYTYDHSYWSFDGSKRLPNGYWEPDSRHPNGRKYCDQRRVFNDLGKMILNNAWAGYNSTLFAYGQTGAGKSYSVFGYGENKGIIPMIYEELFQGIRSDKEHRQFKVKCSMLEIYQEVVHDLLSNSSSKTGLAIREHPKKGFYAEGLTEYLVSSQRDIQDKMEVGIRNRTIKATNMNAVSSRAHTIVTLNFRQKYINNRGKEAVKTSLIHLVDLAGSERVESTGASGDRLKEGASINLSLTCLGDCLNALVKQERGANIRVPFRNSALTKLLMNALGGNSKTIMIAAISPASINYNDIVSTLNYADRAKHIKTRAVVNEAVTEEAIQELEEENGRFRKDKPLKNEKLYDDFVSSVYGSDKKSRERSKTVNPIEEYEAQIEYLKRKYEETLLELKEMKAQLAMYEEGIVNMKSIYEEKLRMARITMNSSQPEIEERAARKIEKYEKEMQIIKSEYEKQLRQAKMESRAIEDLKATLVSYQHEITHIQKLYEEKLKIAEPILKLEEQKSRTPHVFNVNADALLSGKIVHFLSSGTNTIGNKSDIIIIGKGIQEQHAVINVDNNYNVELAPANVSCQVFVNGLLVNNIVKLEHNDRIAFSPSQFWVFQNPYERSSIKEEYSEIVRFEEAYAEVVKKYRRNLYHYSRKNCCCCCCSTEAGCACVIQ